MQDKTRGEFVQEFGEKMALLSKEEKEILSKIVQYSNANQSIPKELKERQNEIKIEATSWLKRFDNINTLYPLREQKNNDQLNIMPLPGELEATHKDFEIKLDELVLKHDEKIKNGTTLERCESMAEFLLETFKLEFNSNSTLTKHSLLIINNLEYILSQIQFMLVLANGVSFGKKLIVIKDIRNIILGSDTKAKQILEMAELGLHESNSKNIVLAMKQEMPKEIYSNPDTLMFTPLITDPLFVAKTHIPMYGRILELLDSEEDLVKIELRNGKSLDYSPLNDKKDNGNQTTSATVEKGIKVNDGKNNSDIMNTIKLSHFEIALLYHYRGVKISHGSSADSIAKKYLQGSGDELMVKVDLIKDSPLEIINNRFSKRYHENIINNGLLDDYPAGKEKASNALERIKLK